jgi:acetyltransferase-like isoleucine patch superfamily enzyme
VLLCGGKIQLYLAPKAKVVAPEGTPSLIGVPLLGYATPRDAVTMIAVKGGATLVLDGAKLGRGTSLVVEPGARVEVGRDSYVCDGSRISATHGVTIGKGCAISWGVTILDDDGHGLGAPPYGAPIVIEDSVWVGCNVTILKGVTIGAGSVVAAGSVVTKSCPPRSLLGGVPAKVVRSPICWTDERGGGGEA